MIEPYKLVNNKGIWYLAGTQDSVLKTFSFNKISNLKATDAKFDIKDEVLQTIQNDDNVWFTQNQIEVILEVDKSVADYFQRRDILPNQTIIEQNDTHIIVSTKVSFEEEILKIVRYWIPNVRIIQPINLQDKLIKGLKEYLCSSVKEAD